MASALLSAFFQDADEALLEQALLYADDCLIPIALGQPDNLTLDLDKKAAGGEGPGARRLPFANHS